MQNHDKIRFNSEEIGKEHDKAAEMRLYLKLIKQFIYEIEHNQPFGFLKNNDWEQNLNTAIEMLEYLSENNKYDLENLEKIKLVVKNTKIKAKKLIQNIQSKNHYKKT